MNLEYLKKSALDLNKRTNEVKLSWEKVDTIDDLLCEVSLHDIKEQERFTKLVVDFISKEINDLHIKEQNIVEKKEDILSILEDSQYVLEKKNESFYKIEDNLGDLGIPTSLEAAYNHLAKAKERVQEIAKILEEELETRPLTTLERETPTYQSVKEFVLEPFDEKGQLKPNIYYQAGEYEYYYETDELGRICKCVTENLHLTNREKRLHHDSHTLGKMDIDHAGHLLADIFGGSPKLSNLISQLATVNQSSYKVLENTWKKALQEKKKVAVEIAVNYDGDNLRPEQFNIRYKINEVDVNIKISNLKEENKNG